MKFVCVILCSFGVLSGAADASLLFATDFQNNSAEPWKQTAARGEIRLNSYDGNLSLRLDRKAQAVAAVDVSAAPAVSISAYMAAYGLKSKDACIVEYSADNAGSWTRVMTVERDRADGATMHRGQATRVETQGDHPLWLRLRADLSVKDAVCWADDITVTTPPPALEPLTSVRRDLPFGELTSGDVAGPVPMNAFLRPPGAVDASHSLEGRLVIGGNIAGGFDVVKNDPFDIEITDEIKNLPAFDFEFVQSGGVLIPLQRGAVIGDQSHWEYVLEPGRVWNEESDGGLSRAALPFSLMERGANCLHNGVMTFVYSSGGEISNVYYQISSETCPYFKFDSWGVASASYSPGAVDGRGEAVAAYEAEVAARLPVRSISELAAAHPDLSLDSFGLAPGTDGDYPTVFGVVVDGVNYRNDCETRAGPYPYCDVIDLPSYSTAKTVLAGVALMRLEQLWPGARHAKISDYVPQCRSDDWAGVTFEHALDMTTGVYDDDGFHGDEMADKATEFYVVETHAEKIDFVCNRYSRKSKPGKTWVYRTMDTYVLSAAMQAFVKEKLGSSADVFDTVLRDALWAPMGLSPVARQTRRTYDVAAQPLAGYGLTYHPDDIARIGRFLSTSDGKLGGKQMLDSAMLNEGLFRDENSPGSYGGYPNFSYNKSFWGRNLKPLLGCGEDRIIPFLSGYGGNSVVLFPDGIVYYYFSDSWVWDWGPAAIEINKFAAICQ